MPPKAIATSPPMAPTAMFICPTPSVIICAKATKQRHAEAAQHHIKVEFGEEVGRDEGERAGAATIAAARPDHSTAEAGAARGSSRDPVALGV